MEKIKTVILFDNGMVMVFDDDGQQMAEFQGQASDVLENLVNTAPAKTEFQYGNWRSGTNPINRTEIMNRM